MTSPPPTPRLAHEIPAVAPPEMRGVHAGAIMLAAVTAANLGNYVFHLAATRLLGTSAYGDVVSLVTLVGLIGLPLAGLQLLMARYAAAFLAEREPESLRALFTRGAIRALQAGALFTLVIVVGTPLIRDWLNLGSSWPVVVAALATVPAVLTPIAWGVTQGVQQFALLGWSMSVGPVVRIAALLVLVGLGLEAGGALVATLVGALASLAVVAPMLRGYWEHSARSAIVRAEIVRASVPVLVGLLAFTSLTTVDVIVAKISFDGDTAGVYGGASLIGRVILYLPAAITTVLLPKISARQHSDQPSEDIVGASLVVTGSFCLLATAVYALGGDLIARVSLGGDFEEAGELLGLFGVAMTGYALVYVLLIQQLALGSARYSWLLLGAAGAQLVGYAAFHETPRQLLAVSIAAAAGALVAHELAVGSGLRLATDWLRALRALVAARGGG